MSTLSARAPDQDLRTDRVLCSLGAGARRNWPSFCTHDVIGLNISVDEFSAIRFDALHILDNYGQRSHSGTLAGRRLCRPPHLMGLDYVTGNLEKVWAASASSEVVTPRLSRKIPHLSTRFLLWPSLPATRKALFRHRCTTTTTKRAQERHSQLLGRGRRQVG